MTSSLRLIGRRTSSNVQKVVWALEEIGVPYERLDMGGKFGGLNSAEFLKMNPNGLIPVLFDGDLKIWESHAVVRYLAAKYDAGGLWPETPEARAVVDQWTDWTAFVFQPAWLAVFYDLVRTLPENRNPELVAAHIARTEKCFGMLDEALSGRDFLGGDRLTYADIVSGICLYRWTTMGQERQAWPNVEAWHERLKARPAYVKAVHVSYEELRGTPPAAPHPDYHDKK